MSLLKKLELSTLRERRKIFRLIFMYEIIHDLVDIKTLRFLALKATYMYLVNVVYTFVSERIS